MSSDDTGSGDALPSALDELLGAVSGESWPSREPEVSISFDCCKSSLPT